MRMFLKGAAIALALSGTMLVTAGTSNAAGFTITTSDRGHDRGRTSVSFSFGDVAYGYQDGYWDNNRRWHKWRSDRDRQYYRDRHGKNYRNGYHHRYRNQGWMSSNNRGNGSVFGISFNTGDVAFAYSDGYWDNNRRWHSWRSDRDRQYYRDNHGSNYRNGRHHRYRGQGWRRN